MKKEIDIEKLIVQSTDLILRGSIGYSHSCTNRIADEVRESLKDIAGLKRTVMILEGALMRACRERKSLGSDYTVDELYNQYYSTEKNLAE